MPFSTKSVAVLILFGISVTSVAAQPRTRAKPAAPPAETKQASDATLQATVLFEAGQDAHQAGRIKEAVRLYGEALAKDPSLWQAAFQRASAYFSLNQLDDARASLKTALNLLGGFADSPELRKITARAHLLRGEIELAAGQYDEAEAAFRRALEMQPDAAQAHAGLAQILLEKNRPADALTEAKAALAAGDDRAITYSVLGEAQLRAGLLEAAVQSFNEALKREPNNPIVLRFRAEAYAAKKDLPSAINDFRASLAEDRSTTTLLRFAALLRAAKRYDEAEQVYRQVTEAEPQNAEARAALAEVMIDSGKAADAIAHLEALIKSDPQRAALRANLAELYFSLHPEKALEQYGEAAKLEPTNPQYRIGVASTLVKLRRFDEAAAMLRPMLAGEPLRDDLAYAAHANLATALFELKDYANAAREYIWLLNHQSDQKRAAVTLYFLGVCLDRLGDYEKALKAYNEFVKLATPEQQLEVDKVKLRLPSLQRQIEQGKGKKK